MMQTRKKECKKQLRASGGWVLTTPGLIPRGKAQPGPCISVVEADHGSGKKCEWVLAADVSLI